VSNVEEFNFCPLRRIRHLLNQQKVRIWHRRGRKNKNYYDRSQYVYENKQHNDKMTGKFADFCAQLKPFLPILQKITGFEGQFAAIFAFGALPCGYLREWGACLGGGTDSHPGRVATPRLVTNPACNHPRPVTTPGAQAPPLLNQEGSPRRAGMGAYRPGKYRKKPRYV
jgi:hypothetical protein